MSGRFKLNTLTVLMLAAAFSWFFMFAKHDPSLAPIVPFADDPWDAIGSYCYIASLLLAGLILFRSLRLGARHRATGSSSLYLARAQMALPAGVLITVIADSLAMAHHSSQWWGKPESRLLVLLLGGLAVFTLLVAAMIRRSTGNLRGAPKPGAMRRTLSTLVVSILVLCFFPESLIQSVPLHFLAILLGFVLIAAPQASIVVTLLPDAYATLPQEPPREIAQMRPWLGWMFAAFAGATIGALLVAAEFIESPSGNAPMSRIARVAALFVGSGTALLLVAYAFLRKPLGLIPLVRHC